MAFARCAAIGLADAVGDEVHHIEARNTLLQQVIHGVRVFLAKDGHQHIGANDLFFAIACGLDMHDGALDDALKAQGGLGVHFIAARYGGGVVFDKSGQRPTQIGRVDGASLQYLGGAGVV